LQDFMVDNLELELQAKIPTTGPPKTPPFQSAKIEPIPVVTYSQMASRYRPRRSSDSSTSGKINTGYTSSPETISISKIPTMEAVRVESDPEVSRSLGAISRGRPNILASPKLVLRKARMSNPD